MKTQVFSFSSSENISVNTNKWLPDEGLHIKGVIQLAHGMAEYAERYAHFAEFLTQHGFLVYANDHRGHGKTAVNESEIGYFSSENGWFKVVDDMYALTKIIKQEYPSLPVFIFGHSMGSFLTRTYICKYPKAINGVILSGTGGNPGIIRHIAKLIVFVCKNFKGKKARVKLLDTMSFGAFNKKIKSPKTAFDWLNTDESEVRKYIEDPLCGALFTVKFFDDLLTGLGFIFRKKNMRNIPLHLPILLISGSEDPVGDFGKGVKSSFKIYKKLGIKDINMTLYPEMRHEIVNEQKKEIVFNDVLAWLNKHI